MPTAAGSASAQPTATAAPIAEATPAAPVEPLPDHGRFPEQLRAARQRGEEALTKAGLRSISLDSVMQPTRESEDGRARWRFGALQTKPCRGCRESVEGEQVGWLLVDEASGAVSMEALGHELTLLEWKRLRLREKQLAKRVGQLPVVRAFCQWAVTNPGVVGCVHWVEEAPVPKCRPGEPACVWRVYLGTDHQTHASRYVTLLIEEGTHKVSVDEFGQPIPLRQWRKDQPF